jgi:hypothetical protein
MKNSRRCGSFSPVRKTGNQMVDYATNVNEAVTLCVSTKIFSKDEQNLSIMSASIKQFIPKLF